MHVSTGFDFSQIPVGKEFRVRMMVSLKGENILGEDRPKLNLALVLDRSGSMGGAKIENVKLAASSVIERLSATDRLSLTVFDESVDVIIPPTKVGDLGSARQLVDEIGPGGCTFLSGGYERGFQNLRPFTGEEIISRVILLTDGLANRGVTDPRHLVAIAKEYRDANITTTTIGTGDDFDEALLTSMAQSGGGSTYFIENPDHAMSVFNEELGYLLELSQSGCRVKFHPTIPGARCAQLNNYRINDDGSYDIGDLYGGQTRTLLMELSVPAQQSTGRIEVGEIEVIAKDLSKETVQDIAVRDKYFLEVVSVDEFALVKADAEITAQSALAAISLAKGRAMKEANNGRFAEAAQILLECIAMISSLNISDQRVITELDLLKTRADGLTHLGAEYYSSHLRKQMSYENALMGEGRGMQYNRMMSRRYDPMSDATPTVRVERGLLFIDIETTGLPKDSHAPSSNTDNWPHLVQIAWALHSISGERISSYSAIIKPEGFIIPLDSVRFHGITHDQAVQTGEGLAAVLQRLEEDLVRADLAIAHNMRFVTGTVECESFRLRRQTQLARMPKLGLISATRDWMAIPGPSGYKFPSLDEIVFKLFQMSTPKRKTVEEKIHEIARSYFELAKRGIILQKTGRKKTLWQKIIH